MISKKNVLPTRQYIAEFNPEILKAIVFDVDETLVHGTTVVKDTVWVDRIFPERKEEIEQVNRMFDRLMPFPNGKFYQGDRRDRIAYMLGLWNVDDSSYREHPEVVHLSEVFEQSIKNKVRSVSVNEDDIEVLRYLKNKMPLHVVSNVPEDILRANLDHYGIVGYFTTIVGTPVKKPEALKQIIDSLNCAPEELLMVGDGNPDHDAAQTIGTQFVGVTEANSDRWVSSSFPRVQSISVLQQLLSP